MAEASTRQTILNHGQTVTSLDQRLLELKEAVQKRKSELKSDTLAYQLTERNFSDGKLESFLDFLHGDLGRQSESRRRTTEAKMSCQERLQEPSKSNLHSQGCCTRGSEQKEEEKEDSSSPGSIITSLAPKDIVLNVLEEITSTVQTSLVSQSTLVHRILLGAKILHTADNTKNHTTTTHRTDLLAFQASAFYNAISAQLSSDTKELQMVKHEQEVWLVSFLQGVKAINAQHSNIWEAGAVTPPANCSKTLAGSSTRSTTTTGIDSCDIKKMQILRESPSSTLKETKRLRETMEGNLETIKGRLQTQEDSIQHLQKVAGDDYVRDDGFTNISQRTQELQRQQKLEVKTAELDLRPSTVALQAEQTYRSKASRKVWPHLRPSRKLTSAMEDLTFVSEVRVE